VLGLNSLVAGTTGVCNSFIFTVYWNELWSTQHVLTFDKSYKAENDLK
jgi:hypothetical protein